MAIVNKQERQRYLGNKEWEGATLIWQRWINQPTRVWNWGQTKLNPRTRSWKVETIQANSGWYSPLLVGEWSHALKAKIIGRAN